MHSKLLYFFPFFFLVCFWLILYLLKLPIRKYLNPRQGLLFNFIPFQFPLHLVLPLSQIFLRSLIFSLFHLLFFSKSSNSEEFSTPTTNRVAINTFAKPEPPRRTLGAIDDSNISKNTDKVLFWFIDV